MALANEHYGIAFDLNAGGTMIPQPPGTPVDNVKTFTIDGTIYRQIFDGRYRAAYCVTGLTGNQTARIQAALNDADVNEMHLDIPVTISGTLNIPAGKKVTFSGAGKWMGTGTINGGVYPILRVNDHYENTLTMVPEEIWTTPGGGSEEGTL
jgi:hypothetical protein